jgi:hypothetical protein
MTNAQKFQEAVEAAQARSDLRSQLGNAVNGEPVQVRVIDAKPTADVRNSARSSKVSAVRQAYAERKDEMVKAAGGNERKPIEVWLTRRNIEITCRVVNEDETATELDVDSLSMRGAQREITAYFKAHGYEPAGRWETESAADDGAAEETVRLFR